MNLDCFPINDDLSPNWPHDPENRHGELGATGTNQAGEAENFALANAQVNCVAGKKWRDEVAEFDPLF